MAHGAKNHSQLSHCCSATRSREELHTECILSALSWKALHTWDALPAHGSHWKEQEFTPSIINVQCVQPCSCGSKGSAQLLISAFLVIPPGSVKSRPFPTLSDIHITRYNLKCFSNWSLHLGWMELSISPSPLPAHEVTLCPIQGVTKMCLKTEMSQNSEHLDFISFHLLNKFGTGLTVILLSWSGLQNSLVPASVVAVY